MSEPKRAAKSGVAFTAEKKLETCYDREEECGTPQAICNWLNAIFEGDHDPIPASDWKTICSHLRDGVALCKAINKLLKADGKSPVSFQKKVMSPFVAMTNLENFNKGAEAYGLAKEFTFQSGDIWEQRKGPLLNFINCIHSLGFVANGKNWSPAYTGEIKKLMDNE